MPTVRIWRLLLQYTMHSEACRCPPLPDSRKRSWSCCLSNLPRRQIFRSKQLEEGRHNYIAEVDKDWRGRSIAVSLMSSSQAESESHTPS